MGSTKKSGRRRVQSTKTTTKKTPRRRPASEAPAEAIDPASLPPRVLQTLERLLQGDSEKQIAVCLGLSRNTVHHYVKDLYRRFDVSSRGELMAMWVRRDEGNGPEGSDKRVEGGGNKQVRPGPAGKRPSRRRQARSAASPAGAS